MPHTFESPRSFDPSYSVLGRAFRAATDDRLRGEAFLIVVLTGLTLILLMTHYLGWALVKPLVATDQWWQVAFWGGQGASVLALIGIGLVGFRPAVTVNCTTHALHLSQGNRTYTLPYDTIEHISTISARQYYRHYRRYSATQIFISRLPDEILLLHTARGPVVTALPVSDDQDTLRSHLEEVRARAEERALSPES